ncbi:hypothetical protein TEMA_40200 [Terrisporobacter mayombei]|uniref:Uncharacterized protein n=1 Tax=Terrisporobacter mayombei TaxID=1541 RepID=A0ABY9QAI6_9FIRM|nr:hypothetical protein TEMA_40200 [Terrisporobacter mayombei]
MKEFTITYEKLILVKKSTTKLILSSAFKIIISVYPIAFSNLDKYCIG